MTAVRAPAAEAGTRVDRAEAIVGKERKKTRG